MNNPEHQQSQILAAQAAVLVREKQHAKARILYAEAADLEQKAFASLPPGIPRTKGILAISLCSLLYKAKEYDRAEEAILRGMIEPDISPPTRKELKELLEVVWDEKALADAGSQYSGEELLVSLRQGEIGYGTAPVDTVLHNIGAFNSLLYRVTEWRGNFAFRTRGLPDKEVTRSAQARVTQPTEGSYRFKVKLLEPAQPDMFDLPRIQPASIASSLVEVVRMAADGETGKFKKVVPDDQYRNALLKLIRNIVPGKSVGEIELTRFSDKIESGKAESVLLSRYSRLNVTKIITESTPQKQTEAVQVRGVLRALHLDRNWLEVTKPDGDHQRFRTREDVLDDVVGPMVNRSVVVKAHRDVHKPAYLLLDDVEVDDDLS